MSDKKLNFSQPTPARDPASGSVGDPISTNAGDSNVVSNASPKLERWLETRDLLTQALADWDKSEILANETLKEAEVEKSELDHLLSNLKLKLEELSK